MNNNNQISDRGVFAKRFDSKSAFVREINGYEFFSSFYTKVPKLLESNDTGELCVVYEKIDSAHNKRVTDMLYINQIVYLRQNFTKLSSIANAYHKKRASTGGTQIFYIDRVGGLTNRQIITDYAGYLSSFQTQVINGRKVFADKDILIQLKQQITSFHHGICIPSQGDIHERNIFTDGCIVDFEGSGWNHVATDLATFLWHTIFAGSHFGPQYARWSTTVDKKLFKEQKTQFISDGKEIIVRLSYARKDLLSQYLNTYLDSLDFLDDQILCDTSNAIAFRLVSTFSPLAMNDSDRMMTFALANFFHNADLNLYDKLKILTK